MMKVKYDKNIDAKYIKIKKGNVFETKRERDWLMLDLNKLGEVIGVEILDASEHNVRVHTDGDIVQIDFEDNESLNSKNVGTLSKSLEGGKVRDLSMNRVGIVA